MDELLMQLVYLVPFTGAHICKKLCLGQGAQKVGAPLPWSNAHGVARQCPDLAFVNF
jgi:hypothetical protein